MYPAVDPTWYAPITIVLAALEVNMASICASVPVFWPVIEQQFGKIFITQEVKVTSEERWQPRFQDEESLTELTTRGESGKSPTSSDHDVGKLEPAHMGKSNRDSFLDDFLIGRIDPFKMRQGSVPNAQATIQAQGSSNRASWWRL